MRSSLLLALVILLPGSAQADAEHGKFTKHKSGSFFKVTAKKHFSIELDLAGDALKVGENTAEIVIHDREDRDVKGAEVTLTPWMPAMGHGVPEKPVVEEEEGLFGSRYHVRNLVINMGGHWEILVEVKKGGLEDGAVFDFPQVGGGAMKTMKKAPADLDLSTTRPSFRKVFTVSYASAPTPPPLNKIHSWTLQVKTAEGEPVKGAVITVDGDMPEHGHGLPTSPEVSEEGAEGAYLAEGMKFTMPGWWVVNFHIKAGDRQDRVTFNLRLE